jgi:RNA polymerase sigma-70 factor (TIGR02943 family)
MSESGPDTPVWPTELSNPDEWVEQHGNIMFAYALRSVGNRSTAEGLVQDALLGAFRGRHTFSGASAERTWLIGILKNKVMDHFRRSGRETAIADLEQLSDSDDPDFIASGPDAGQWKPNRRPAAWSVDSDDPVEQKQFWEQLQHCLEKIDDRLARVYRLRDVQDMEYREACNVLSVTPTNLRVMLHRARKLLRSCLETNWIGA